MIFWAIGLALACLNVGIFLYQRHRWPVPVASFAYRALNGAIFVVVILAIASFGLALATEPGVYIPGS